MLRIVLLPLREILTATEEVRVTVLSTRQSAFQMLTSRTTRHARQIASGLKNLGLKEGSRVSIYADTS